MNITEVVPDNITVPEGVGYGSSYGPLYRPGYINGYKAGFKFAIDAFQELISLIFAVSVVFWISRIVLNRMDVDTTAKVVCWEWNIDNAVLKKIACDACFTVILAVSGFLAYYMVM